MSSDAPRRPGRPPALTDEMKQQIENLLREGWSIAEVAMRLQVNARTVRRSLPKGWRQSVARGAEDRGSVADELHARVLDWAIEGLLQAYGVTSQELEPWMVGDDGPFASPAALGRWFATHREPTLAAVSRLVYAVRNARQEVAAADPVDSSWVAGAGSAAHDLLVASRTPATLISSASIAGQLLAYVSRPLSGAAEAAKTVRAMDRALTWPINMTIDGALGSDRVLTVEERQSIVANLIAAVQSSEAQVASRWFLANVLNLLPRVSRHTSSDDQLRLAEVLHEFYEKPTRMTADPLAERSWHVGWLGWWTQLMKGAGAQVPPGDMAVAIPARFLAYIERIDLGQTDDDSVLERTEVFDSMRLNLDYLDRLCGADEGTREALYRAAVRFLTRSAAHDQPLAALDIRALTWALRLSPRLVEFPGVRQEIREVTRIERAWSLPKIDVLPAKARRQVDEALRAISASTDSYLQVLIDATEPFLRHRPMPLDEGGHK